MRKLHIATTIAARASENYHFSGQLQKTTTFAFNGFKKLPVCVTIGLAHLIKFLTEMAHHVIQIENLIKWWAISVRNMIKLDQTECYTQLVVF
jgi:hypothetical protein